MHFGTGLFVLKIDLGGQSLGAPSQPTPHANETTQLCCVAEQGHALVKSFYNCVGTRGCKASLHCPVTECERDQHIKATISRCH